MPTSRPTCYLALTLLAPIAHAENLSEFSQPEGFSEPVTRKVAGFDVGFSHESELDLSDNINLYPAPNDADGFRYIGNIKANFSGKALSSDVQGSIGYEYTEQSDFSRDTDNQNNNLILDLGVRSQFSQITENTLSLELSNETITQSQAIYNSKLTGSIASEQIEDTLTLKLTDLWQVSATGTGIFQEYEATQSALTGNAPAQNIQFDRDNKALRVEADRSLADGAQIYGLAQITSSTGGALSTDTLDQDSMSVGVGVKQLTKPIKYQVEIAYGKADTETSTSGTISTSEQKALFGQISVEYPLSSKSRVYAGIMREVDVDIISSATGALVTDAILHWQYTPTADSYTGLKLEYPYISLMNTNYRFEVPEITATAGYRFNKQVNVEASLSHQKQTVNDAAKSADFTEYSETALKLTLNWFF